MSATLAEKVMGRLAGRAVQAGEMVEIGPDWTFALDDGIGLIDQNFRRYGVDRLAHPGKIALFFDHYAPADTPVHAHVQRVGRRMFEQFKLPRERLFDVGEGISHQIAVESGMVLPGQMVTNMDAHTITIGAVGALGCGIGGAEMAYLRALVPLLAAPNRVDNVHPMADFSHVRIQQAFLGTCTNGRLEDFAIAAAILRGKRIAPGVRMVVTPASRKVYAQALKAGVIATLVDAGATVTTPGCGACAGMHQGGAGRGGNLHRFVKPQLPGPDGPPGRFRVPGLPGHRRCQRTDRTHHRPARGAQFGAVRQTRIAARELRAGVHMCLLAAAFAQYSRNWASDSALSFASPNGSACFIAETMQVSTIFSVSNWSHAVSASSVDTMTAQGTRRRPCRPAGSGQPGVVALIVGTGPDRSSIMGHCGIGLQAIGWPTLPARAKQPAPYC